MTRPEWDCTWESPTEEEVARRTTGGDGRSTSVGHAIVSGLAWLLLAPLRVARWMFTVERRER